MVHILVVEDDKALNQLVCTYLRDSGYAATGCLNGQSAYDEMYNSLYDLIISDIMMPGVDGFAFARTIRDLNKTIPILFMSARDDLAAKQEGFNIGIDDYMVKPIELGELGLRVKALLRRAGIEASRKLTRRRRHELHGGRRRDRPDHPGVQRDLQAAVLPEQDLLPGSAAGRVLGAGQLHQPPGGGRVCDQAPGQAVRLRRVHHQDRPGPGL